MGRPAKYTSAAEKQKAYRMRKRNATVANRNALAVFTCDDCGRRFIGFGSIPDDGCGCPESAGRVRSFTFSLESNN